MHGARDEPVSLELAQSLGQDLRGDAVDEVPQVAGFAAGAAFAVITLLVCAIFLPGIPRADAPAAS